MPDLRTAVQRLAQKVEETWKPLRVEFFDRHIEHALDPELPLCEHQEYELQVGDTFRASVSWTIDELLLRGKIIDPIVEIEVVHMGGGEIRLIVNQPDYLTARKRLSEGGDRLASQGKEA
jgi:hypothetical protein